MSIPFIDLQALFVVFMVFLNVGSIVLLIIMLASLGWWFFQPPQGTIVFINKGEELSETWVNVGGHKISKKEDPDGKHWIVKEKDRKKIEEASFHGSSLKWFQKMLWAKFGIRFISPFWPQVYVNKFNVDRKRLAERDVKDKSLKKYIVDSPNIGKEVDNLRFVSYRPVYKHGVELAGDNSKINLLLLPTWQLVHPTTPIYFYMGNFYPLLDSAIEAAIEDFFATHRVAVYKGNQNEGKEDEFAHDEYNPLSNDEDLTPEDYKKKYKPCLLTYSHWIKLKKAENSPIERHLVSFNATREYYNRIKETVKTEPEMKEILAQLDHLTQNIYKDEDELKNEESPDNKKRKPRAKGLGEGIIPSIGYALIAFRLVDWEAHGDTIKLAAALQAEQTEKYMAAGEIKKAAGKREATILEGQGEAQRFGDLIRVQTELGVHPDNATITLRETEKASKIGGKDSKVTHWFEKSGNISGGHPPIAISDSPSPGSQTNENDNS